MAVSTDTSTETTLQLYSNPLLIQDKVLSLFEEYVFNGRAVLDGNNVFTFGLEMEASMTAGIVNEMTNGFQSLYPARAQTMSDLYRHMSDYDYIDMFSTPAGTTVEVMFDRDFLINNAPMTDTGADYNKVVIPEHSVFTIGEHKFGIHYPIEIQIRKGYKPDGSVDHNHCLFLCQWDTSTANPLHTLTTNVLEHRIYQREGLNLLCISIPIEQFKIDTKVEDTISSTGFFKRYTYTDKFYAARVFHFYNDQWVEMASTLSDVIYNPNIPTAKIKVLSDIHVLEVSLPQVYFTDGVVGNRIKTVIYTTEGALDIDISTYGPEQFAASFLIDDVVVDDTYSAFLKRVPLLQVIPLSSRISSGSDGKSFSEMKNRVINTIGGDDLLVTPGQIEAHLSDIGFTVSKYLDNITDRIYLARKAITNANGTTVASGEYKTTITAAMLKQAGSNNVYDTIKVVDSNASQFVILPNTIFKYDRKTDCMIPLSRYERQELYNYTTEKFINEMNSNTYTFTPFHIKLSTDNELPIAGAYDLMKPSISGITFTGENEMTNTQVSMYSYNLAHVDNGTGGYKLLVSLFKTDDLKTVPGWTSTSSALSKENISVILRATNYNNTLVYLEGKYLRADATGRDIYEFNITTEYKIDKNDNIDSQSFIPISDYATMAIESKFNLSHKFELMFFVHESFIEDTDARARSLAEAGIPKVMRTKKMVWVATQECMITFGEPISSLKANCFINMKGKTYATYPTTTFATHTVDLYERDEDGNLKLDDNGQLIVKHPAGALIMSTTDDTLPDVRPPACDITWTDEEAGETRVSTTYMNPDRLSATAERRNIWDPYRAYTDKDDGLVYAIITGQHKIYTSDLLKLMIDTVDNNRGSLELLSVDKLYRNVVNGALEAPIPGEFVFVKNANSELDRSDPMYLIFCTDQILNSRRYNLVQYSDTMMTHEEVIDDYNCCTVDDDGNMTWVDLETIPEVSRIQQYGALYRRDANKAEFNYSAYISTELLGSFYSAVDATGRITEDILKAFNIDKNVATQLLDMRFPWVKVVEAGNFEIIKEYWNNRTYNNFDMNLIIDGHAGVQALDFIKQQSEYQSAIPRCAKMFDEVIDGTTVKGAISTVNEATSYGLVWCENYDRSADESLVDGYETELITQLDINEAGTRGALLWPGSIYSGNTKRGKHYVVISGPSINVCYQHLMNYNTDSGIAYVCDRYEYDDDNLTTGPIETAGYTNVPFCFGYFNESVTEIIDDVPVEVGTTRGLKYLARYENLQAGTVYKDHIVYYQRATNGKFEILNSVDGFVIGTEIEATNIYVKVKVGLENLAVMKEILCDKILFYSGNYIGRYLNVVDTRIDFHNTSWISSGGYWPWETTNWADNQGVSIGNKGVSFSLSSKTDTKILHLMGDVILGNNGLPVVNDDEDERQLIYRVNMIHVDHKVVESNDSSYTTFRDEVRELLRSYFNLLDATKPMLLERTELYYSPIQSMGYGNFKGQDGETMSIPLEMTIDLRLHVLPSVSGDANMKETIRTNILSIIDDHVATGAVNCAILAEQIRSAMSDTVLFVDVLGINGDPNIQTLIAEDTTLHTPRLKTILILEEDGSIGVDKGLNLTWSTIR